MQTYKKLVAIASLSSISASVLDLGLTAKCATGWSTWDTSYLVDYGCFCGLGVAWGDAIPRDGIDNCCRIHDYCYTDINFQVSKYDSKNDLLKDVTEIYNYDYDWKCEKTKKNNKKGKRKQFDRVICTKPEGFDNLMQKLNLQGDPELLKKYAPVIGYKKCKCDEAMATCFRKNGKIHSEFYEFREEVGKDQCYEDNSPYFWQTNELKDGATGLSNRGIDWDSLPEKANCKKLNNKECKKLKKNIKKRNKLRELVAINEEFADDFLAHYENEEE